MRRRPTGGISDGWSVRSQLIAAVAGVVLLLALGIAWVAAATFSDIEARAHDDAAFQAGLAARAVEESLGGALPTIARTAATVRVGDIVADPVRCQLNAGTAGLFPEAHVGVVLADGSVPCTSREVPPPAGATPYAGMPWLDATREPGITAPFVDPVTGSTALAVSAATVPTAGEPQAFIVYVLPVAGLAEGLEQSFAGPRGFGFLVVDDQEATLSQTPGVPVAATADDSWVVGSSPVEAGGWSVVAAQPRSLALGPAMTTFTRLGVLVGAAFLVLLTLLVALNRRIAQPLRRLTLATEQAGRQVVPTPVPEQGPVELRRLASRFNEMVATGVEYERRLEHRALHDALTGLPNRALLLDRLDAALTGAPGGCAVLSVDIDRFKLVNAGLGYRGGDEVLDLTAARLRELLGPRDTLARCAGDGFVLCSPGTGSDAAQALAEQVLATCARPFVVNGTQLTLSASVGIALSSPGATPDELLRDADTALYVAKDAGGDRCRTIDDDLRTQHAQRLTLEADLRAALERDELHLVYQPVVNLLTREITGVEALVRWAHPARGTVAPMDFIPLAEETGLIVPVGRLVLEQACTQAAAWNALGHRLRVAVNVSGLQLLDPSFVEHVAALLRAHQLPGEQLCLELTETTLMDDAVRVPQVLRELKELGVDLSVDDFGTGYSSLAYLSRFPVDELKIDRSFVQQLDGNGDDALVAAMVAMGHALGLNVIAEGIENERQVTCLLTVGCRAAQGFLFSRPQPPAALTALLRTGLSQGTTAPRAPAARRPRRLTNVRQNP